MALLWIILGIILLFFLSDYIWIILLAVAAVVILQYTMKAREEKAEQEYRNRETQTALNSDPTHKYYFKTTGVPPQNTHTHVNHQNASPNKTDPIPCVSTPKNSNPTAQNAYIFNIDYIRSCEAAFIAIDVETTGLSPSSDRIIELSAVKFVNYTPCNTFSTLINPQRHIPESASSVNHIYDKDVADAPLEHNAIQAFCDFIGKDALNGEIVLVAHNAQFDIKFLLHALSRSGVEASIQYQDTLYLCRHALLGTSDHKLQTIAEYYGIVQNNAHRALDDARTCGEIFIRLMQAKYSQHTEKFRYLSQDEMNLCVWLKEIIVEAGLNVQLLTFNNKGYLQLRCINEVARFKTKAKKTYALIPKDISMPDGVEAITASKSESEKYLRVYFSTPTDLALLKQYYTDAYRKAFSQAESYIGNSTERMRSVARQIDHDICI